MNDASFPILYKRTTSGAVQMWYGAVDGDEYTTSSGRIDGKITTTKPTKCTPKNAGKANAVTPEEQAVLELQALYTKKKRQDFRENIEDIDTDTRFKPMLAAKWADESKNLREDETIFLQPKLDGFRCVARATGLETRDGLPIPTAPHVMAALQPLFDSYPDVAFDGELYNHDLHEDFNTISSILRKKKPSEPDLIRSARFTQYHVYDLPSAGRLPYADRHMQLQQFLNELDNLALETVKLVPTTITLAKDENVVEYLDASLDSGYEGAIVRLNRPYEHKRSKNLLKVKKFLDAEFIITDILEGKGNWAGKAAKVELRTDEGQKFEVGIIGSQEYAAELLARKDEFIGQRGTVKFLRWTPAPRCVPYGGKFKEVRFG